ncbi:MAG: sulfite exporter TauE/SafE family protein [Clostridia bacterium]|nr:sulfite exporter TauE/SafE family protein [Clostridia bacterium]
MEGIIEKVVSAITESMWLAPLLALFGGILTSLMPCSLSTVPLVIGCVGGGEAKGKRAFGLSLLFAAGSSITFITLGVIASAAGLLLEEAEVWMHLALAVLLVLMALQMWGVINIIPSGNLYAGRNLRGGWGAFIAGLLAGVFSAHCAAPVIVALLAIVIDRGQIVFGVILLLLFSIGHGILSIVAGTSVGLVQKITENPKYEKIGKIIKICLGIVIMLAALYLLWEAISEGLLGHEHAHGAVLLGKGAGWLL